MKKPIHTLTTGEFFDRFTILIRKDHFDHKTYGAQLDQFIQQLGDNGKLFYLLCKLMMVNTDVWNLEFDVRRGQEDELGLAEVGRRAIKVREHNNIRIQCINEICSYFGEFAHEKKYQHVSDIENES